VGEVASSNLVVPTIYFPMFFGSLQRNPSFISNSTQATLVEAVAFEESLSVSASAILREPGIASGDIVFLGTDTVFVVSPALDGVPDFIPRLSQAG
jgi:hypothetical protein